MIKCVESLIREKFKNNMKIYELIALAIGLSMDAFAVSICKGLSSKKTTLKQMATCGIWFGGFQALMPLIGFFVGAIFASAIEKIDHWIAFGLLVIIGANMLKEAFSKEQDSNDKNGDFSFKTMLTMAVATSIDALAVGVSLSMAGNVNIWIAIALIGTITFLFSFIGVKIGGVFGDKFEKKAQILGGVILILIGVKILLEHLGIF